uniref:Porin n=1 Tax=Candidatus Kentrum sp. FM TaxID=2126340 RepID=A0A450VN37_9GAMM|nr:MAG: porin [Candidatus Kentron sp. FM]VFJ66506.1 MAG: porin [Candidatus Kentron sp. FM]VFK06195.1 MAG: porin [Candidatus Kentron sp. FM]
MSVSGYATAVLFPRVDARIAPITFLIATLSSPAYAYDITDNFSIGGTVTGVYQYGEFSGAKNEHGETIDDTGRATVVTDIRFDFRPTDKDRFNIVLSFAAGNALNEISPYPEHPLYADELEDLVEDISGRGRDYLMEAWYKHTFTFSTDVSLGITGGFIKSTDWLDDNAYANEEIEQYMNDAFVNNTLMIPPNFVPGIATEFEFGDNWSFRNVWINGKNEVHWKEKEEERRTFNYFGSQIGYHMQTGLGRGNYRLLFQITSNDFLDANHTGTEDLTSIGFSLDQQLGDTFGAFARFGWQDDDAEVSHDTLYSGGLYIDGSLWGRAHQDAGLAYAYLDGGNESIDNTSIFEAYVRFPLWEHVEISLDLQYLDADTDTDGEPHGFIYGIRTNTHF